MTKIVPVILAGGAGTRLWPVSRDALPKQFLPLVGERSTYQDTLLRVAEGGLFAPPIVITGADFRFFARRQAEEIGIDADRRDRADAPQFRPGAWRRRRRSPGAAIPTRWCWRSPPTTSSSTSRNSAPPASPGSRRRRPDTSSPSASRRARPRPATATSAAASRSAPTRRLRGRSVRGKAERRHRGALCRRGLSVEFGQFPVSRRRAARGACALRAGHGGGGGGGGRRRQQRSRLRAARRRRRLPARRRNRSTMR